MAHGVHAVGGSSVSITTSGSSLTRGSRFRARVSDLIGDIDLIMGFVVTTLSFIAIGIIACFCTRICCNKGPSANLFHLTLVITATICCWMMWAIVYLAQMNPLIVPILSEEE
ncbi:hypothetical protein R6Q59_009623 [Mikania micrantha]